MAIPNFDPRNGGGCSNCMANKFCSIVVGWVQLVISVLGFFTIIFKPSTAPDMVKNLDTKTTVMAGFLTLCCIMFAVILLIGLHKDRRWYVKTYCVYVVVYLVLLVISFITSLFFQPQNIGVSGFFSIVMCFLMNLLYFFVVRSYYLITYCNNTGQPFANQNKV